MKSLLQFTIVLFTVFSFTDITGQPWELVRETENAQRLVAISFPDSLHGWMVGNKPGDNRGYIINTTDGGDTWDEQVSSVSNLLHDVHFFNQDTGFVLGLSSIQKTVDGGAVWTEVELDSLSMNPAFVSFDFIDSTAYAVGDGGILLKSTDGGDTWTELTPLNSMAFYHAVDFTNQDTGIVVGGYGTLQYALRTVDGGMNWDSLDIEMTESFPDGSFLDVFFVEDSIVYVTGRLGKVARSYDYGETWQEMTRIKIASEALLENTALFFQDADTGWVASTLLNKQAALINRTNDGGVTWREELFFIQSPDVGIFDLVFTENGRGWACGHQSGLTLNGEVIFKGIGEVNTGIADSRSISSKVNLFQNHPNPFNTDTEFLLDLNEEANIKLKIFTTSGHLVENLFDGVLPSGRHTFPFNASSLPGGVYISMLHIDGITLSRQILLTR